MDSTARHRCLSTVDRLVLERGELDPLEFLLAMGCLARLKTVASMRLRFLSGLATGGLRQGLGLGVGRGAWRGRGEISGGGGSFKKKKYNSGQRNQRPMRWHLARVGQHSVRTDASD